MRWRLGGVLLCGACAILIGGCSTRPRAPQPCTLPELTRVDPGVQTQARERYQSLLDRLSRGSSDEDLAGAYGSLGMLLQAAEYYDAAEPCYVDAQALAPADMRWPYYLAHLYKSTGNRTRAEASFRRVLELRMDDFPTLVWLGRLYLDGGRPEDAEPLFARAAAIVPNAVAALAGSGNAALARRDYARAAKHFEDALAIDPEADSLHAPLAMAYRGLGDLDKAQPHLRQWKNREILVPDPLRQELDLLLESGLSYELRGVRALEAKDWKTAAAHFRRGLALTPDNSPLRRSLHHKLGTALYMLEDLPGAEEQFEQVVTLAPADGIDESAAKAQYSLGVLMASRDERAAALEHFSAAVKLQPTYFEAELALADLLRRAGRAGASLSHYKEALAINPRLSQARLGYALALADLRRDAAARDWLIDASEHYADHPEFRHALARLLVASPDARVRDGRRAKVIVDDLLTKQKTTDLGETLAMTLAELGEYDEAVSVQRGVLAAAAKAGLAASVSRMSENLRLYERRQPCRIPWRVDEVAAIPSATNAGTPASR